MYVCFVERKRIDSNVANRVRYLPDGLGVLALGTLLRTSVDDDDSRASLAIASSPSFACVLQDFLRPTICKPIYTMFKYSNLRHAELICYYTHLRIDLFLVPQDDALLRVGPIDLRLDAIQHRFTRIAPFLQRGRYLANVLRLNVPADRNVHLELAVPLVQLALDYVCTI